MILNVADTSARYTKTKETWSSLRRFHLVDAEEEGEEDLLSKKDLNNPDS